MEATMKLGFSLPMAGAWATPDNPVLIAQRAETLKQFRMVTPRLDRERTAFQAATAQRAQLDNAIAKCLVSARMETPRVVRILPRGNWQADSGEIMRPAFIDGGWREIDTVEDLHRAQQLIDW